MRVKIIYLHLISRVCSPAHLSNFIYISMIASVTIEKAAARTVSLVVYPMSIRSTRSRQKILNLMLSADQGIQMIQLAVLKNVQLLTVMAHQGIQMIRQIHQLAVFQAILVKIPVVIKTIPLISTMERTPP